MDAITKMFGSIEKEKQERRRLEATATPWGVPQSHENLGEGIDWYSTASHGGIRLSAERENKLRTKFGPSWQSFAGPCWYEEDDDVSAVVIAFPTTFTEQAVYNAVRHALATAGREDHPQKFPKRGDRWAGVREYLASTQGINVRKIAESFAVGIQHKWERGGLYGDRHGWTVYLTRVCDKAPKTVVMSSYPDKQFYTDEELERAGAVEPVA